MSAKGDTTPPPVQLNGNAESQQSQVVAVRESLGLDHTLAVPAKPRILELATTSVASTQAFANTTPRAEVSVEERLLELALREPSRHPNFSDTYGTDNGQARELGRGGIGRVVLVFDRTLGRDVALKELLPELLAEQENQDEITQAMTMRFLREARITGQLEHPNIVPVYELGREPNGRLYYTMRVVRGRTLTSAIRDAKNLAERLALINHFADLCQAIAYAHSRGVLHRDIKPDNVMIGEFGETFVLDWGIAKIVEVASPQSLRAAASLSHPPPPQRNATVVSDGTAASFNTQSGSIVGTPLYMSPEQILQTPDSSRPTADVWSLGVVLYYVLTGKLPFGGSTLNQLVSAILEATPEEILAICPEVPRDLAAISKRALAKEPAARYESARELAKDIAAYQAGEKVAAYEYGSTELLRRFVNRNRPAVLVTCAATLALIVLLLSSYRRVSSARDDAVVAERRASQGEQRAKSSLSDVLLERARASSEQGDYATSTILAAGALELFERPDARGLVIAQANTERLQPLPLPQGLSNCDAAKWNAALRQLACRVGNVLSLGTTDAMRAITDLPPLGDAQLVSLGERGWLQQLPSGQGLQILRDGTWSLWDSAPPRGGILAVDEAGRTMARGDDKGLVEIYSLPNAAPIAQQRVGLPVTALAFHVREPVIAIGTYRGEILLWNWQTDGRPTLLGQSRSTVHALAFAPRSNLILSGGADRSVLLWDTKQRQLSLMPLRADSPVTSLAWANDGTWFAVGSTTTGIDLIDGQRLERTLRVAPKSSSVRELLFSSSHEIFGIGGDGQPFSFELRKSQPPARFASRGNVLSLAWAAEGQKVLIAGLGDKGLCHLQLAEGVCTDRLPLRLGLVRRIVISSDGALVALGGTGGNVEFWNAREKIPVGYVSVPIPEVRDLQFTRNGRSLLVAGTKAVLATIDIPSMRVAENHPIPAPIQAMALLPESERVLLALRNGELAVWSIGQSRVIRSVKLCKDWVMGVVASESKDWLAATTAEGELVFLSISTLQEESRLRLHDGRPTTLAYSPTLELIATGGEDRQIQLVSTQQSRGVLVTLNEHQGTVRSLLFDSTTPRLLSGGDDGLVRLWDLRDVSAPPTELRKKIEQQYGLVLESGRVVPTKSHR